MRLNGSIISIEKNTSQNKYIFIISRPVNEHIIMSRRLEFLEDKKNCLKVPSFQL